jgi:hypothetical protein
MAVREIIFPVAQILEKRKVPSEVWTYLATLYSVQEKIGIDGELWNREFVDGISAFTTNSYVKGVIDAKAHSFPKTYKEIWPEFQIMMNDIYLILDPIPLARLEPQMYDIYLKRAGIIEQPKVERMPGFFVYLNELVASDNTIIANNLTTPQLFADAWNNLLVPYEKSIGVDLQYITPLLGPNSQYFYRKSTLLNPYSSGLLS